MKRWIFPVLAFALLTPFFPSWDIQAAQYFYNPETGKFSQSTILEAIYTYGVYPANTISAIALVVAAGSFLRAEWKHFRRLALLLALTQLLCSGLLVNGILKEYWGRPRPRQIEQFGGKEQYRKYYEPHVVWEGKRYHSFPSGHASTGWYPLTLCVAGIRSRKRWLLAVGLAMTATLGVALAFTRVAQGGHFVSDVTMSALLMWLTAVTLDAILYRKEDAHSYEGAH